MNIDTSSPEATQAWLKRALKARDKQASDAEVKARADRIAKAVVAATDALMIYAAAWHFLGGWGLVLALGLYGRFKRPSK